jgi:hypothetical protein
LKFIDQTDKLFNQEFSVISGFEKLELDIFMTPESVVNGILGDSWTPPQAMFDLPDPEVTPKLCSVHVR